MPQLPVHLFFLVIPLAYAVTVNLHLHHSGSSNHSLSNPKKYFVHQTVLKTQNHTVWKPHNHTVLNHTVHHVVLKPHNHSVHHIVSHAQVSHSVVVHVSAKNLSSVANKAGSIIKSIAHTSSTSRKGLHDFTWGNKTTHDRLLYSSRIKKGSSLLRKVTTEVDFPAKNQQPKGTIHYVEVLDQEPAEKGGYASIVRGGSGYKNVTLKFKSQRNKPFDFLVNIYGY